MTESPSVRSVALPNGIVLEYLAQGDASGVPVIFLHGFPDSWRSFEDVLSHLPGSLRVYALTQRGHGGSSHPLSGYQMPDFASDVALFMDALDVPQAFIVGHSMGSLIAQRFAIEHPERILGLVLMGSFATAQGNIVVQELLEAVLTIDDPVPRAFIEEFQVSTIAQPVSPALVDMVVTESQKLPRHVWLGAVSGIQEVHHTSELVKISAPTLLVWGDRDAIALRRDQEMLLQGIAGSRLVVYRDAGHSFHWENPVRFAADISAFVMEVGSRN